MKQRIFSVLGVIGHVMYISFKFIVRVLLTIDRKVLKRHFGLETPLYKIWWESYTESMQKKLEASRNVGVTSSYEVK